MIFVSVLSSPNTYLKEKVTATEKFKHSLLVVVCWLKENGEYSTSFINSSPNFNKGRIFEVEAETYLKGIFGRISFKSISVSPINWFDKPTSESQTLAWKDGVEYWKISDMDKAIPIPNTTLELKDQEV